MKNKKKKLIVIISIIIIVLIIAVILAKTINKDNNTTSVQTTQIKKGSIRSDIFTEGIIKAKEQSQIVLDLPYPVTEIFVEEGNKVEKGEVLAKLDTKTLELEVIKAEINLQIEKKKLDDLVNGINNIKLKKELENSKSAYENAKKEFERFQILIDEGAISSKEFEEKKLIYTRAKNEYELAMENLKRNDDFKAQEKKVELQKADLSLLKEKLERAIIKSPIDGVIVNSNVKKGILATSSNILFVIDNTDELEAEVNISEFDVNSIRLGQGVEITGDAFEGKKYKGKVTYIAPAAQITRTNAGEETSVKVKINIENPTKDLKPGFSANIAINTGFKEEILTLPYEATLHKKDGNYVVFRVENNKVQEIPVEIGIEGDINIQIKSDKLKEGDKVVLNPTEIISDGMNVKVLEASGHN